MEARSRATPTIYHDSLPAYPRHSGKTYARREPFLGRPRTDSRTMRGDFRLCAILTPKLLASLSEWWPKPRAWSAVTS